MVTTAQALPDLNTVVGDVFLTWYYDGTSYFLFGDTFEGDRAAETYTTLYGHDAGANATGIEYSTYVGYNAGKSQTIGFGHVAVGYNAGIDPGGNATTCLGWQAGENGGGESLVSIGYDNATAADKTGTGNVFLGVHTAASLATVTRTVAAGYHTLNGGGTSSASSSVIIGDHAGASANIHADNCIFLGPFSGIDRNKTLWIDGTGAAIDGTKPLIYGEFDNRKFTINGDGLFGRSATNDTAAASAALEVRSTSQGFLLPRMTKAQRGGITPVAGLAIYQTDNTPGLRVYNGTNWMRYTETTD